MLTPDSLQQPIDGAVSPEVVTLSLDDTVAGALTMLRDQAIQPKIFYLYVVDRDRVLKGVVPVRSLLSHPPETPLQEIMIRQVRSLRLGMTRAEALDFFATYRFLALPMVDQRGRLIGYVSVEQFSDEMVEIAEGRVSQDIFSLVGIKQEEVTLRSAWSQIRQRAPWLAINVAGGLGCAWILGVFQLTLAKALFITFFIPIVLVLAEGIGMQSAATAVLRIHRLPERSLRWRRLLLREGTVAVGVGLMVSVPVCALAYLHFRQSWFAWALGLGVTASMGFAGLVGTSLPLLFHRWKVDPTVSSGPLVLAVSDNLTLLIYLGLTRFLLRTA